MNHPSDLPLHLDYTTLYGAALALESNQSNAPALPLSRLLCLSHVIESVVLFETIQFELGNTDDWARYREALERTVLYDEFIRTRALPLAACTKQVDASDADIIEAGTWAARQIATQPLGPLAWAVRFRSGTYSAISVADAVNPVTARYLALLRQANRPQLESALTVLANNDIGTLGLHVLMRLRLIERAFVDTASAHYAPHYSRQPLVLDTAASNADLQVWTMEQIREARQAIVAVTDPKATPDTLAVALSPVFLACLDRAKTPRDLLTTARVLRDSQPAKDYRNECRALWTARRDHGHSAVQLYKWRLHSAAVNLRDFLFEQGRRIDHVTEWRAGVAPLPTAGWTSGVRRTTPAAAGPSDRATVFLSNLLQHALGVADAQKSIERIFGTDAHYDTEIISCAVPALAAHLAPSRA